jgi:hypothetical protein
MAEWRKIQERACADLAAGAGSSIIVTQSDTGSREPRVHLAQLDEDNFSTIYGRGRLREGECRYKVAGGLFRPRPSGGREHDLSGETTKQEATSIPSTS